MNTLTRLKSFFDEHLAQVQAPKNQFNLQSVKELTERHNVDSFIKHAAVVESELCVELADKPEKAFRWTGETIVDADHDYLNDLQSFDFYSDDESRVEDLDQLVEHVDGTNSKKTYNYLSSSARYLAGSDDMLVLDIAFMVYLKFEEYPFALQIALYLDNREYMTQVFTSCDDLFRKKQFCYTIAHHVSNFELSDEMVAEDEEREALQDIINNTKLSEGYLTPARDIEVMEAKTPEDIYKGTILLGDVPGLDQTDKYFHSNDNHVIAGLLFGVGIVNCSIKNDCDPALALLSKYIDKEDPSIRIGAIMGIGIAYAGTENEQIRSKLIPILNDAKAPLDVIRFAAISLGLLYISSCNEEVAQTIISVLTDRTEAELGEPLGRLIPLSLGLLYLGKQESVEATAEVSRKFNEKIRKHCDMTLLSCAYAGTGYVLKVENLLGHCSQVLEKGETHQGPAVLGIAMVVMAEESGPEKAIHSLKHLLQYGERNIRRAVPFALGLLFISNPKIEVSVLDTLSMLSHDSAAMAAVISLGLMGAGTNNGRTATRLLNLSSCYCKDASQVIYTRIIQGLDHLGKGLLTLKSYHSDR